MVIYYLFFLNDTLYLNIKNEENSCLEYLKLIYHNLLNS